MSISLQIITRFILKDIQSLRMKQPKFYKPITAQLNSKSLNQFPTYIHGHQVREDLILSNTVEKQNIILHSEF